MGVIVWLLIPIGAVVVAIVWTALLARKERRRADEKWRAARMAELGAVLLTAGESPEPSGAQSAQEGDERPVDELPRDELPVDAGAAADDADGEAVDFPSMEAATAELDGRHDS